MACSKATNLPVSKSISIAAQNTPQHQEKAGNRAIHHSSFGEVAHDVYMDECQAAN